MGLHFLTKMALPCSKLGLATPSPLPPEIVPEFRSPIFDIKTDDECKRIQNDAFWQKDSHINWVYDIP